MHVDHIGIATNDAAAFGDRYGEAFGLKVAHEEVFEGMHVTFLEAGDIHLELLEPIADESPIGRFLDTNGPGLHHVAFEVDNVETALEGAREAGVDPIDETPRPGAWGHTVAFLHPKSTGSVLVEFVEH